MQKKFKTESIIDFKQKTLDTNVFDISKNPPILKSHIKDQIIRGLRLINKDFDVDDFFLVGSILTCRYLPNSDIDVTVEVASMGDTARIRKIIDTLNGLTAKGTLHPINYFAIDHPFETQKADNIYDISTDSWIKTSNPKEGKIAEAYDSFNTIVKGVDIKKEKLRRDVIDLKILKLVESLNVPEQKLLYIKINEKLKAIKREMQKLVAFFDTVVKNRREAFIKKLSDDEMEKLGSKNNLYDNLLYKFFERYEYTNLYHKLKHTLNARKLKTKKLLEIL